MPAAPSGFDIPSFEVNVAALPRAGHAVRLHANAAERERIAEACGVAGFDALEADLKAMRWRGGGVELRGEIHGVVRQNCVVTLEPLVNEIREPVAMTFLPEAAGSARRNSDPSGELVLDPEGPDAPETFSGDTIDLWPVVVECLLLAIDPFPRARGATFDAAAAGSGGGSDDDSGDESPFSVLKSLNKGANKAR